jgi:hypothetical protein
MPQQGHTELVSDSDCGVTAIGRNRHPRVLLPEEQQEVAEVSPIGAYRERRDVGANRVVS